MATLDRHVFHCFKTQDDFLNLNYKVAGRFFVPAYSEKQAKWLIHNRDIIPSEYKYAVYKGCCGVLDYYESRDEFEYLQKQQPINNDIQIFTF